MVFIGREREQELLSLALQIQNVVLVSGLAGVGKTYLVQKVLSEGGQKHLSYRFYPYCQLHEVLGTKESSLETILQECESDWSDYDIILWENVETLSDSALQTLSGFIQWKQKRPVRHIFCSTRDLSSFFTAEAYSLLISPLTVEETESYITAHPLQPSVQNTEEAHSATGGLPFLLNLWMQRGSTSSLFTQKNIALLSTTAQSVFKNLCAIGKPIGKVQFEAFMGVSQDEIDTSLSELSQHYLISKTENSILSIPPSLNSLVLQEKTPEEREEFHQIYHQFLTQVDPNISIDLLVSSLRVGETSALNQIFSSLPLEVLESRSQEELLELKELLNASSLLTHTQKSMELFAVANQWYLRILLLRDERREALTLAEDHLQKFRPQRLSKHQQNLLLECIQTLNRTGKGSEVTTQAQKIQDFFTEPERTLLRIENAVGTINADVESARQLLYQLLSEIEDHSEMPRHKHCVAQSLFQLARSEDLSGNLDTAQSLYQRAETLFSELDQPYFKAISSINSAWCLYHRGQFRELEDAIKNVETLGEAFAYPYVRAGFLILGSLIDNMELRLPHSLKRLEQSLELLSDQGPLVARVDAHAQMAMTFQLWGFRSLAFAQLEKAKNLVSYAPSPFLKERCQQIQGELELPEKDLEQLQEWHEQSTSPVSNFLCQLYAGKIPKTSESLPQEKKVQQRTLLLSLYSLEAQILAAIQEDRESAWPFILQMEKQLKSLDTIVDWHVALPLLQATMSQKGAIQHSYLENAQVILKRWQADEEVKSALQAWLSSIEHSIPIEQTPDWKKSPSGHRRRWQLWWSPLIINRQANYNILTSESEFQTEVLPKLDYQVCIYEFSSEVYINNQIEKALSGRHQMRRLLILFLEHGTNELSKADLAGTLWGENYNPEIHDARVYMSIQRLRRILPFPEMILSSEQGYRWNTTFTFALVRSIRKGKKTFSRVQSLILRALQTRTEAGSPMISRRELVQFVGASEATIKRELAKLLEANLISRHGMGRAVTYSLI